MRIFFFLRENNTTLTLHEISYGSPYKNLHNKREFHAFRLGDSHILRKGVNTFLLVLSLISA